MENRDNARILVIGAGTNGSICAVSLFNRGFNVTVLARGERYNQIKSLGILMENPFTQARTAVKVPVINMLDPQDTYDYILVVVRKSQVLDLLPVLAQNKSPCIVFMSNNLSGPDELIKVVGKERVLMGFVFGSGKLDNGVVYAYTAKGKVANPIGEIHGAITPRLTRLVSIFNQAGLFVKESSNIQDFLTTHAAIVALLAIPIIRSKLDLKAYARSSHYQKLSINAIREFAGFFHAIGHKIIPGNMTIIKFIPHFIIIIVLRFLFSSRIGEVTFWDVTVPQGVAEANCLAKELEELVNKAGLPVPHIRKVLGMEQL